MSVASPSDKPDQPGPGGLDLSAPKAGAPADGEQPRRSLLVGAGVIFDSRRQEVLVTRRRSDDFLGGLWELPGGKVEAFEDPRECLRREIEEEIAAEVTVGRVLETIYSEYENFAVIILCYLCELLPGAEPKPVEVEKAEWVPLAELDGREFVPGDVAYIAELAQAARDGKRPLG